MNNGDSVPIKSRPCKKKLKKKKKFKKDFCFSNNKKTAATGRWSQTTPYLIEVDRGLFKKKLDEWVSLEINSNDLSQNISKLEMCINTLSDWLHSSNNQNVITELKQVLESRQINMESRRTSTTKMWRNLNEMLNAPQEEINPFEDSISDSDSVDFDDEAFEKEALDDTADILLDKESILPYTEHILPYTKPILPQGYRISCAPADDQLRYFSNFKDRKVLWYLPLCADGQPGLLPK